MQLVQHRHRDLPVHHVAGTGRALGFVDEVDRFRLVVGQVDRWDVGQRTVVPPPEFVGLSHVSNICSNTGKVNNRNDFQPNLWTRNA